MADDPLKLLLELDAKVRGLLGLDQQLEGTSKSARESRKELQALRKQLSALRVPEQIHSLKKELHELRSPPGVIARGLEGLNERAGDFARETLAHFTALAGFEGLKRLVEGVVDLGKELVTVTAHAQRTETSFKLLLGAEKGSDLLEYLDKIAGVTEFDDDDLKGMAQDLLKVGVAADKIPDMIAAGLDIAAFSKTGVEGLQAATAAFERLAQSGQVDFKILKGLGIQKPEFLKDLAKETGLGVKELEDKMQKGKLDVDILTQQLYRSVTKKTGLKLGGAGVHVGEGLEAKITHLKNTPEDLFKAIAKGPQAEQLATAFGRIGDMLGPDGPIGKKIVAGLGGAFTKAAEWLSKLDIDKLTDDLLSFWDTAKTVFGFFATVFGIVAKVFDFVGTTIGEAVAAVYLFVEDLIGFGEKIGDFFGGVYVSVSSALEQAILAVTGFFGKVLDVGKQLGVYLWTGLRDGILGGITAIGNAVGDLAFSAVSKVKGLLGIHSPSTVFMEMGDMTGEGYARGVLGSADRVDQAVGDTFNVDAPSAAAAPRAIGGGPISITIPITVNATGGGEDHARSIAEQIRDLLPGELQAAFEQLRLELGVD